MRRFKITLMVVAMLIMAISANAYPWLSPYAYCMNNPVKFVDPDGRDTYLYATTLPGGPSLLSVATHTFLVVTGPNGNVRGYFACGSEYDGVKRIIDIANSFGNNPGITYFMTPITETQGNCNTSTSTILQKSGVSTEDMDEIKDQIPGISTGFNTDTTRPWTEEEQKDAVKRNNANDFYKEVFNQAR